MQKLSLKVLLRFLSVYSHWNLGDNNYFSRRIIDSFQRIVKLQFCSPQEDVASVQQNRNTCFYFFITRGKFSLNGRNAQKLVKYNNAKNTTFEIDKNNDDNIHK